MMVASSSGIGSSLVGLESLPAPISRDGWVGFRSNLYGCDRIAKMLEIDFVFFGDGSEINTFHSIQQELEIAFVLLF